MNQGKIKRWRTIHEGTRWEDCGPPIDERLSDVCLLAGRWEMANWSLEYRHRSPGHIAGTNGKQRAELCDGRRGSSSPRGFPSFLWGDAPRGMRWHPCVSRASARRWGFPSPRLGAGRHRTNRLSTPRSTRRSPTQKSKAGHSRRDFSRSAPAG
jgi:hypothetical protein